MDQDLNWITLVDEEGHEHRFNLINVLELEGMKYAVMIPELHEDEEAAEEEEEAVIFRIEADADGEEVLVDIEDDDEFNRVCEALEELAEAEEEEEEEKE